MRDFKYKLIRKRIFCRRFQNITWLENEYVFSDFKLIWLERDFVLRDFKNILFRRTTCF